MIQKKKRPGISPSRRVRADVDWVTLGIDQSFTCCAIGAIARTSQGKLRVTAGSVRWVRGTDYFQRLKEIALVPGTLIQALWHELAIDPDPDQVFITYEEPVSYGHLQRGEGRVIKQQCQISGAMVGALLAGGYPNLYEIQANQWRAMVARDLGITTSKPKWAPPELAPVFHCHPNNVGKFRAKQWVEEFHPRWDGGWADIISRGRYGNMPRPSDSQAMGIQSADEYEALAMAEFGRREIKKSGT